MVANLTKTPLTALLTGALLWFLVALFPYSQGYAEATAAFAMPVTGYIFMVAYGLLFSVGMAIVFGNARSKGFRLVLPLILAVCGIQWIVPLLRQLILGETTEAMTFMDTVFWILSGCAATTVILILMALLFKGEEKPGPRPGAPRPPEPKYKRSILGLGIRILVLPVIYMVLYYPVWYVLFWRVDAAREFHGVAERASFLQTILIDIVVNDTKQVAMVLIMGLAYGLFSLPLLFQLPGKRGMFILSNAILYATGGLLFLIPTPFMPDAVRMAHFLETGIVLAVYGALVGLLLHTAIRKEEAPVTRTASRPGVPRPAAPKSAAPPAVQDGAGDS